MDMQYISPLKTVKKGFCTRDSPGCGRARLVATAHRTVAKSRLSNPPSKYPYQTQNTSR